MAEYMDVNAFGDVAPSESDMDPTLSQASGNLQVCDISKENCLKEEALKSVQEVEIDTS